MAKITPHLWFDNQAKEATTLYTSLFPNSQIKSVNTLKDTPSGDTDIVDFTLAGQNFMAISAGPIFKFNPSISFFTVFDNEVDTKKVWDILIKGGMALMPYDTYPWAHKYGWLQDKYGLSWQLSFSDHHQFPQKITPLLMFTQKLVGQVKEALDFYTSIIPNSQIDLIDYYKEGEGDKQDFIKHAQFTLDGFHFMAMESSLDHKFTFNEAISFIVNCKDQKEIDYFWDKLSSVPEAEQCGWLKDKFGVSWQIVPSNMGELLSKGTPEQIHRVTQAFLKMKKFDIKTLEDAYNTP